MFSKFFINRPVFACVISIIIVIAGILGLKNAPVEEYPQLTPPQVVVSASYSGADAETIANSVATILENAINGVEDMIYMDSTSSSAGQMTLNIYFKIGTDPQVARTNVNNRVSIAQRRLPTEVQQVGISVYDRSGDMLEMIAFYDKEEATDSVEMYNYASINIVDSLKRVEGVGNAIAIGSKDYSMRVWLNPDAMHKFGVTATDITAAISEQNNQYPAGKIGEKPMEDGVPFVYAIKSESKLKTVADFENIVIRVKNQNFLRLKDVARIELGAQTDSFHGEFEGHSMIPITILMQNGANALATVERVNAKMEELKERFPGTLTYSVAYDTTKFIKASVKEVVKTFVEAILLVMLIVYLFLGSIRSTIIPMIAVPVSILGAFGGLYVAGFSINLITLFGLVLAIGIVVDDAIIVIENVERVLRANPHFSVKQATEEAMNEIMAPVISIVLVLSAVFIPVAFMEGFVGVIQRQFAITLVISVCISGFVALTLTPALCALMLKKEHTKPFWFIQKFNDFFELSTRLYGAGVTKVLKHIIPSLLCVAAVIVCMIGLFKAVPSGLVPNEDKGAVMAIVNLPPAATAERTLKDIKYITSVAKSDPNVNVVAGMAGYDMLAGSLRENAAMLFFDLKDWKERVGEKSSNSDLATKFNGILYMTDRDSMTYVVTPPPIMGLSMTGGFEVYAMNVEGKNYEQIEADMHELVTKANAHPALKMVRTTLETNFPQYNIRVDREKVKMLGLSLSDVFSTLSATIGTKYVNDINLLGKSFQVNVRADAPYRNSPEDLSGIYARNAAGEMIPLSSVATLSRSLGADIVNRFNAFPAAKIMGEPADGYTSGDAIKAMQEVVKEVLPTGYDLGWSGTAYQEINSSGKGAIAFVYGLVFVFLILAAQYERWLMPLAIVTAVPFSVFGSLLFTWARGLNNDIYFQIGLLLLIGLAAKNAILIVEFAMQEHLQNRKSIVTAAISAAKMRFRPIVMTSLAFILGVLPMMFATGAGAGSRHAIATGVVGGMIAASTLAIFFVPVFFCLLERFNEWLDKKRGKLPQRSENE